MFQLFNKFDQKIKAQFVDVSIQSVQEQALLQVRREFECVRRPPSSAARVSRVEIWTREIDDILSQLFAMY